MGNQPTFRASLALLTFIHGFAVQAQAPAPVPELNLTSTIVRSLGLRLEGYDDMTKLKQGGCEKELTRIRGANVASIGGQRVSIGAAASLYYVGGQLRSGDPAKVPEWAQSQVEPATTGAIRQTREFFDRGIQSQDPAAYKTLQEDLGRVQTALEERATQLGTQEARALSDGFRVLRNRVGLAQIEAAKNERVARLTPKEYEGATELFRQTGNILDNELPKVMRLVSEAETATAASTASAAVRSAQAEMAETVALGSRGRSSPVETTGESAASGLAGKGVVALNWMTVVIVAVGAIAGSLDTPERQAKHYAEKGAKVAEAWKSQPEATDAYVFGGPVAQVCARAVKDPKGFGKVVSEKLGAVEWWDKLQRTMELEKYLKGGDMMASRNTSEFTMVAIYEGPGKRLGDDPDTGGGRPGPYRGTDGYSGSQQPGGDIAI